MDGSGGPAVHGRPKPIPGSPTRTSQERALEYFSQMEGKPSTISSIDLSKLIPDENRVEPFTRGSRAASPNLAIQREKYHAPGECFSFDGNGIKG